MSKIQRATRLFIYSEKNNSSDLVQISTPDKIVIRSIKSGKDILSLTCDEYREVNKSVYRMID